MKRKRDAGKKSDGADPKRGSRQIEQLVSKSASARDDAYLRLNDSLYADGSWTAPGLEAIPQLLDIAESSKEGAHRAMWLLADILAGGHARAIEHGLGEDAAAAEAEVARRLDALLGQLASRDPRRRSAAALVLAFAEGQAGRVASALGARLAEEKDACAKASMLIAMALLAKWAGAEVDADAILAVRREPDSALARGAAALASLMLGARGWKKSLGEGLRDWLVADVDLEAFPWCRGNSQWLLAQVARAGGEGAVEESLAALCEIARSEPDLDAATRAAQAAQFLCGFTERWQETDVAPVDELDDRQKTVAEALAARDGLRGVGWGMPPAARDRRGWLGLAPPRVMEKPVRGQPLWRLWRSLAEQGQAAQGIPESIAADLSPAEQLDAAVALLLDAYRVRQLSGAWVSLEDMLALLERAGDVTDWAVSMAGELGPRFAARHEVECGMLFAAPAEVAFPILLPIARAGRAIEPGWDAMVPWAPAELARELFLRMPAERREERIHQLLTVFPSMATEYGLEQVLPLLDIVSSARIVAVLAGRLGNKFVKRKLGAKKVAALRAQLDGEARRF
ncbi:MAG: hypothetical protein JXR96_13125 [Deltaproteobacteria bacterium]|nr:hypothetical protein [Deltaproteobacteria bacterium]